MWKNEELEEIRFLDEPFEFIKEYVKDFIFWNKNKSLSFFVWWIRNFIIIRVNAFKSNKLKQ